MPVPLHAMFVHAHPDDESSKGAATMARYVKEGYRVSVVTCTDGAAGDILNPAMDRPGIRERMPDVRAGELARALEILGITDHFDLGYKDSGYVEDFEGDGAQLPADCFYNVPLDESAGHLAAVIRAERPDVVVTYPENGGYPHPDHIRCHEITVRAVEFAAVNAGDRARWQVPKLYYSGAFNRRQIQALHDAYVADGVESPFSEWIANWNSSEEQSRITTRVEIGDYLAQRTQALIAHATQVDPTGWWFKLSDDRIRQVYPYEDYILARSTVDTEIPEDSLFAGLPER